VQHVRDSIAGITTATGELTEALKGIHGVARQQAQGLMQVAASVEQMGQVTQGNAANAEEGAAASEVLHAQAADSLKLVFALEVIAGAARHAPAETREIGRFSRMRRQAAAEMAPRRTGTHG
jgi:methyl-accepting chemotaxis protein